MESSTSARMYWPISSWTSVKMLSSKARCRSLVRLVTRLSRISVPSFRKKNERIGTRTTKNTRLNPETSLLPALVRYGTQSLPPVRNGCWMVADNPIAHRRQPARQGNLVDPIRID